MCNIILDPCSTVDLNIYKAVCLINVNLTIKEKIAALD